jgi:hypothetical protein
MRFGQQQDEVQLYLDARWVGPPEAAWRIFHFSMHSEFPSVERLQVHEENMQYVTWNQSNEPDLRDIVEAATGKDTTLMAYFKANQKYPEARQLLY